MPPDTARWGSMLVLLLDLPSCPLPMPARLPAMLDAPDNCLAGPDGAFMKEAVATLPVQSLHA